MAAGHRKRTLNDLSAWQIEVGTARSAILDEVARMAETVGIGRAERLFVSMAKAGDLPPAMQDLLRIANARRGNKGRTISKSRLWAWRRLAAGAATPVERIVRLAPGTRGKKWTLSEDVAVVLAAYRQPNKPSLSGCAQDASNRLGVPFGALYSRCRRALKKLPKQIFYVGRHSGAALKALQPFRRREYLSLSPNDIWVGDGHAAKLKIAHPDTGNPFQPEVTVMVDVCDRYIVGWSVSLSENCLAVSAALRHGVSQHGIPLIYYSDNGGGQKNKMLDAPVTGITAALGTQHKTGDPGNPQGRGVIERLWPTVLIPLAKRFATYQGRGADHDTLRDVSREIHQQLREAKRAEVAVLPKKLPTWPQFIDALAAEIENYNTKHRHSSLPKLDGVNHATPAEYRAHRLATANVEIHIPPEAELAALFMPSVMRKCERGEVRLFNGIYFHKDLMLIDGRYAPVGYDIHDCSRVWVKNPDGGQLIAVAELDGNRSNYFPKPFIERLRAERAGRRRKLLESKLDDVQDELDGASPLDARARRTLGSTVIPAELAVAQEKLAATPPRIVRLPETARSRDNKWKELDRRVSLGAALTEEERGIYNGYQQTADFRAFRNIEQHLGGNNAETGAT